MTGERRIGRRDVYEGTQQGLFVDFYWPQVMA